MIFIALIILSADIAPEPSIPPHPCPLADIMGARLEVDPAPEGNACRVEQGLRAAGWSDPWIAGALANAWHESGWRSDAVGDSGHAVGFWQLRDDGLGSGMGDLRYDLRHATDRVIRSAQRQKLRTDRGNVRHAADKFCQLIMRPSDKVRKGEQRAETAARLSADDSI